MSRVRGKLARVGDKWVITDLDPDVAIRLKANFLKVPKTAVGRFELRADAMTAADLVWFMSRYPLAMADEDRQALDRDHDRHRSAQAEVDAIMAPGYVPPPFGGLREGQEMRAHQARAIALLQRFEGLLVADEMGEGKTYTGAAACLMAGALPAVIVCPPNLRLQWQRKIGEFTTLSTHVVQKTTPYALPPVDVRIFGYTTLAGWIDYLDTLGTGLVVFDELHELRRAEGGGSDPVAKGVAARKLAEVARYRLGLTGTPVFNYGDEIWNVMSYLRPEVLGEAADFYREWCEAGRSVKDPRALGSMLREQNALIRKEGQGPKPNTLVQEIDHDASALASVELLAHQLAYKATRGTYTERGQAVRELDLMLRMQTGVAKAKAVAAYVRIIVEAGEPVLLFGWHREVYEIWLRELRDLGCVMYTGSETYRAKEEAKRAFLAGEAKVFIMSLRSGAGLDGLQARAKVCIFGELDWSPQMHAQCIGRLNREGQTCWPEPVTAIYLVATDGSDPPMQDMLGIKAGQAHNIVDPHLGEVRVKRDEKPFELLVKRYLERRAA